MKFRQFYKATASCDATGHLAPRLHSPHKQGTHQSRDHDDHCGSASHGKGSHAASGHLGTSCGDHGHPVKPANAAPVITSPDSVSTLENTTAIGTISAVDADGDALSFSIKGGADADLFALDPLSGVLSFKTAPDFEAPGDAGSDNIYDVIVGVSDALVTTLQALQVIVQDVAEPLNAAPQITGYTDFSRVGNLAIDIGQSPARAGIRLGEAGQIGFITAIDPDGDDLSYTITGGADADRFSVDGFGALSAPTALDAFGSADGDDFYNLILTVSDGHGGTATLELDYGVLTSG